MTAIVTARLRLEPATTELVDAELDDPRLLADLLGAELPPDWPPEHHDADVLRFTRDLLADERAAGWWLHWFLLTSGVDRPVLAGTGGFVGPPVEGTVEIGYSVVPSLQRRGIASEASQGLIDAAWERGARRVIAKTLPELRPSLGVLQKLGFAPIEAPEPGVLAFALDRPA